MMSGCHQNVTQVLSMPPGASHLATATHTSGSDVVCSGLKLPGKKEAPQLRKQAGCIIIHAANPQLLRGRI